MNFRDYLDYERGGLRGYLAKGHKTGPGSHGSFRWYVGADGKVVYGDRPTEERTPRAVHERWPAESHVGDYWHQGEHARYLFAHDGTVHISAGDQLKPIGHTQHNPHKPAANQYSYQIELPSLHTAEYDETQGLKRFSRYHHDRDLLSRDMVDVADRHVAASLQHTFGPLTRPKDGGHETGEMSEDGPYTG